MIFRCFYLPVFSSFLLYQELQGHLPFFTRFLPDDIKTRWLPILSKKLSLLKSFMFRQQAVLGWPNLLAEQVSHIKSYIFFCLHSQIVFSWEWEMNVERKVGWNQIREFTFWCLRASRESLRPLKRPSKARNGKNITRIVWLLRAFRPSWCLPLCSQACLPIHMRLLGCLTISLCLPALLPWSRVCIRVCFPNQLSFYRSSMCFCNI